MNLRLTLRSPADELFQDYRVQANTNSPARFNIAPGQSIATVRSICGERRADVFQWGGHDAASGPPAGPLADARAPVPAVRAAVLSALVSQRCLVPADGFYSWAAPANDAQPYYLGVDGFRPFALAAIWQREHLDSDTGWCSILTTKANDLLADIDTRMPMILREEDYRLWLHDDAYDAASLDHLFEPFPASRMAGYAVSSKVLDPRNDGEELVIPLDPRNRWPHLEMRA